MRFDIQRVRRFRMRAHGRAAAAGDGLRRFAGWRAVAELCGENGRKWGEQCQSPKRLPSLTEIKPPALEKSVVQRQEPACSQLSRKLKQSFSFAAGYFNVKWVSAGQGCLKLYIHCFSYKFNCAKLTQLQLKNQRRAGCREGLVVVQTSEK